jgi:ATP-binding cassette subfamily B protein
MSMMGHLGGRGSGAAGGWAGLRGLRRDRAVLEHRIKPGTTRRILTFAKPYRGVLTLFMGAVVLDAVVSAINPLILRSLIDKGILGKDQALVVQLALVVAALAVLDAAISLFERRISASIGEGLIFDMRAKVFRHIQSMPVAFFSRTQTGALISRLNNDVLGAQQAFTDLLSNVVGNVVLVSIILVTMFVLSWQITLVALILLPLFLIPARRVGQRLGHMMREGYKVNADMNIVMTERFNVSGAMLVKLYGQPELEAQSFEEQASLVRDIGIAQATYARVFFICLTLTASLATAFAYGFGGVAAINGEIQVGTLVALTAYLARLYGPLTQLSTMQLDVMTTLVSFERLFEVLDLEPSIQEAHEASAIPEGPVTVSFEHVSFSYPSAEQVSLASLESVAVLDKTLSGEVIHDVSFTIEPGSLTALVGPSGAGKTTLSALLARLYDVADGSISMNGLDLRQATFQSLRDTIGVVTQDPHLFHASLRANLVYARPEATEEEIRQALDDAQIRSLVLSLPQGLDTVVGERGYRLSGGEKQRVALARLLLKAPRVVVLDEATAHLDAESEAAVQRALARTLGGRTSLVIAHRLSTIRDADQILVVEGGQIVQRGDHRSLLAEGGLYRELYETQFADQDTQSGEPF